MVSSFVSFNMASNREKRQQKKRLFYQLDESDADFLTGQSNQKAHAESRASMVDICISSKNINSPIQVDSAKMGMRTLEENIISKVRSEVVNVMTTVEIRVQDAVLIAIEIVMTPRVQLALKSTNASWGWSVDGNVLETDQRDFSGNIKGLQRTASSRINWHT